MTIEERAREYCKDQWDAPTAMKAYIDGATEQKAIDDEVIKKLMSIVEHSARRAAIAELEREILDYLYD